MAKTAARKDQHLDVILAGKARHGRAGGFADIHFVHEALPDLDHGKIDLGVDFLGRRLKAPLLISAMTGGPRRAEAINARLANIGAAQLTRGFGVDEARRVLDMIAADALVVHLNPLQEACQPEGDRDWWRVGAALEALVKALDAPVVVKETGAGVSAATAKRLADMGVAAIDVAGAGGSNWATVEGERAGDPADKSHAAAFADWGIPTARAIAEVRAACPKTLIIGSGGIADGVDAARAIRLGADMVGQAAGVLTAATVSTEAVEAHFQTLIRQLRTVCFCTGSANLTALRKAPLQG